MFLQTFFGCVLGYWHALCAGWTPDWATGCCGQGWRTLSPPESAGLPSHQCFLKVYSKMAPVPQSMLRSDRAKRYSCADKYRIYLYQHLDHTTGHHHVNLYAQGVTKKLINAYIHICPAFISDIWNPIKVYRQRPTKCCLLSSVKLFDKHVKQTKILPLIMLQLPTIYSKLRHFCFVKVIKLY